jgi:hypothetical protein
MVSHQSMPRPGRLVGRCADAMYCVADGSNNCSDLRDYVLHCNLSIGARHEG